MRWLSPRARPRSLEWLANRHRMPAAGDRRRLCDLLNADSLDDLVRVACAESAACGVDRLFVVGWNAHQLGPWAIFPHSAETRDLSEATEARLIAGRDRIAADPAPGVLLDQARAVGFDGMAVVPSRRHLSFHVYWGFSPEAPMRCDPRAGGAWSDFEVALCNFARLEQLRELSHIDTLTNIFNRRYFNLRLSEEVARATRFARPLSLSICDLDRFKALNDTHGHQVGDAILRYTAQTLRRTVRAIDIVCRLGGDEFAILMPDTDADECRILAERLRQALAAGRFTLGRGQSGGEVLNLQLSLGGASFPRHAERAERLLWCADMALLEAKRQGGNLFVLSDPARHRRGVAL